MRGNLFDAVTLIVTLIVTINCHFVNCHFQPPL